MSQLNLPKCRLSTGQCSLAFRGAKEYKLLPQNTRNIKNISTTSYINNHIWLTTWLVGRDPFNQNFRKFRSKTQWIGSVQPEKFRKNGSTFWGEPLPGRTGWNFCWIDRARGLSQNVRLMYEKFLERLTTLTISAGLDTDLQRKGPYLKTAICPKLLHAAK